MVDIQVQESFVVYNRANYIHVILGGTQASIHVLYIGHIKLWVVFIVVT